LDVARPEEPEKKRVRGLADRQPLPVVAVEHLADTASLTTETTAEPSSVEDLADAASPTTEQMAEPSSVERFHRYFSG
jgi:hypothetical protein